MSRHRLLAMFKDFDDAFDVVDKIKAKSLSGVEVDDIEDEIQRLRANKVSLIDERPTKGIEGRLVAFVHPRSTGGVLIELVQSTEGVE